MPLFLLSGLIIFSKYLLSHGEHRKVEAICLSRPTQSLPLPIQQHLYFCPWFLLLHHIIFTAVALNSTPTVTVKIIPLCLSAHAFILSLCAGSFPFELKSACFFLFFNVIRLRIILLCFQRLAFRKNYWRAVPLICHPLFTLPLALRSIWCMVLFCILNTTTTWQGQLLQFYRRCCDTKETSNHSNSHGSTSAQSVHLCPILYSMLPT